MPPNGRRCPGCHGPVANIRARISRYEKAAAQANEACNWDKVLHYSTLLERDIELYRDAVNTDAGPRRPPPAATRADEFTFDRTATWSDEVLAHAYCEMAEADDVPAMEALERIMDHRDEIDRQRAAEAALRDVERQRQAEWDSWDYHHDDNPLTNPAVRGQKCDPVNTERACRAEYDSYVYIQYLQAEEECRGNMLNAEGRAKGIDPMSLFSGPNAVAAAYASPELKTFFGNNGRVTYVEWRYSALGRQSDRRAAQTARYQDIGEYVQ